MSDVPPPNLRNSDSAWIRQAFVLFGRGLIYAFAFWTVYRVMLLVYPFGDASPDASERLQKRYSTQMNTYDEQTRRAEQMIDETAKQQARTRALISKQEEQAQRFDAILEKWEKQSVVRK